MNQFFRYRLDQFLFWTLTLGFHAYTRLYLIDEASASQFVLEIAVRNVLLAGVIYFNLRVAVPLPATIDVSFATPDKRWGAARTKPTVNLFLWDIRREPRSARSGYLEERTAAGDIRP